MAQASFHSNDFDFAKCASGKILDSEAASCRFAREVFCIDFVEGGKVFHVSKEAGRFYYIVHGSFHFFQNGFYVFANLLCLSGDVGGDDFPAVGSIPICPERNTNPPACFACE